MLKWSHMKQPERRDCSYGCHMPHETVSVVRHSQGTWARSSVRCAIILTESNSTQRTTLVHLFECLGLVNPQDSHGMQGRGYLARSTISFGRESGRQFTGFGQETWTVPPSGGILWAQVHRDHSLHLGNARVPPVSPAIKVSEDGGDGRAASGRESGHPLVVTLTHRYL